MRRTLGDYFSPGTAKQRSRPVTLRAVLEEDREVSFLLETDPDWTEEELKAAIRERQQQLDNRCLLIVPRLWTHEEWSARVGAPIATKSPPE